MTTANIVQKDDYSFKFFIEGELCEQDREKLLEIPGCDNWDGEKKQPFWARNKNIQTYKRINPKWYGRYLFYNEVLDRLKSLGIEYFIEEAVEEDYGNFKSMVEDCLYVKDLKEVSIKSKTKIQLKPHQLVASAYLMCAGKCLFADSVGTGKTAAVFNSILSLLEKSGMEKVLWLTRNNLKEQTRMEWKKFTGRDDAVVCRGEKLDRQLILKRFHDDENTIIFCNYEQLLYEEKMIKDLPVTILVVDEISHFKGYGSKRQKILKTLTGWRGYKTDFVWGVGATPIENELEDLYTIMRCIEPQMLGYFKGFRSRYIKTGYWGNVEGYKNQDELKEKLSPFILKRTRKEIGNSMPSTQIKNHWVDLLKDQRELYEEVEEEEVKEFFDENELGETISFTNAMTKMVRSRQVVLSPDIVDETVKKNAKLDFVLELLEEIPKDEKVIIFCSWEQPLLRLQEALQKAKEVSFFISGAINEKKRQDIIEEFRDSTIGRVLLSTDCISYGQNIQFANRMIMYDLPFNPAVLKQRVGRIVRTGQEKQTYIHNIICRDTVEEKIIQALEKKQLVIDSIFDSEKEIEISCNELKDVLLKE